jgi:hypothetical protein
MVHFFPEHRRGLRRLRQAAEHFHLGNGVRASSSGLAPTSKSVGAGPAQLLIKAQGKKKRKLNETGKVKLNVAVTYHRPAATRAPSRSR